MNKIFTYCIIINAILSSCIVEGNSPWINWNNYAYNHGQAADSFQIPSPPNPPGYTVDRISDSLLWSASRKNQYGYTFSALNNQCTVYCGPRSYLIFDSNSNFVCVRDTNNQYYGSLSNNGTSYHPYCIPDVDESSGCNGMGLDLRNLQVGKCNSSTWTNTYAVNLDSNYTCCYNNNNNPSLSANGVLTDETNSTIDGSLVDLRSVE